MLRQLLAVTLTLGAALATPVTNPGPPGPADPKRPILWNSRSQYLMDTYYDSIPHSYSVPDGYFRSPKYMTPGLHPVPLDGQEAIEDRVSTQYGLNLYDGGTWEIALALSNEFELQDVYNRQILYGSTTGRQDDIGGLKDIRGDTADFKYGAGAVAGDSLAKVSLPGIAKNPNDATETTIPGAFYYRMIASCYQCEDPLIGKYAESFRFNTSDTSKGAKGPSWNTQGVIIWNDWKPITGEQAWAVFIGPLQYLYLKTNGSIPLFKDHKTAPAEIQLAISILPAIKAMTSAPGSMYHIPKGGDMYPEDKEEAENVSNENNFSMYSGLRMLEFLLANNTKGSDAILTQAKTDVDDAIKALEKWFETGLFSEPLQFVSTEPAVKVVTQGGHVTFSGVYTPVGIMDYSGFAVDCQTWGLTTLVAYLGLDWVEGHLGKGGAYNLWQQVKQRGGYFINGSIAGVGFTQVINETCVNVTHTKDNNTCTEHTVWSAEWSFGAALCAKTLASAYEKAGNAQYATELRADVSSIREHVMKNITEGGLHNLEQDGGMMYANKRFFIPWGWYANEVSSLCSTSWSIMDEHDYNPFVLGGNTTNVLKPAPGTVMRAMATGKSAGLHSM